MIGQVQLLNRLNSLIEHDNFPRFSIIVGQDGSGKSLVAAEVASKLTKFVSPNIGIKIDDIRDMIRDSYKIADSIVYIIPDADGMSLVAKNALLKVTEEPPNNAYFIMTLQNIDNTLATIRSRATIFYMDNYSKEELEQVTKSTHQPLQDGDMDIILSVCETPKEVYNLLYYGVKQFNEYVELVVDNIASVSLANVFKIADKIAFKEEATVEEPKYNLALFWKAFATCCINRCVIGERMASVYLRMAVTTNKHLRGVTLKSVNKQMLFDMWILDIVKIWKEEGV